MSKQTPAIAELKRLAMEATKQRCPSIPDRLITCRNYTDKTANGLSQMVIDFIRLKGGQAERIAVTGRHIRQADGSTKWIKSSMTIGTADISATIRGRSVKIEIKCAATGDNKQSEAQQRYQKEVEQAGGIYLIVRTFVGFWEWYGNLFKDVYQSELQQPGTTLKGLDRTIDESSNTGSHDCEPQI